MRNKGLIATIVVLVAVIITLIAVVFLMQMPTIFSINEIKDSFIKHKETGMIISTSEIPTVDESETTSYKRSVTASIETYTGYDDHIVIDYPQIDGLENTNKQDEINYKIRINALSIVPLYPISTALQKLNVSCEVKYLDDNYITIVYEGRVVGSSLKESSGNTSKNNSSRNNTSRKKTTTPDPYLDGFVDPLTLYTQYNQNNMNYNVYETKESATTEAIITYNNNNNNITPTNNSSDTADKGPTVHEIKSPTAPYSAMAPTGNMAENYPTNTTNVFSNGFSYDALDANGAYRSPSSIDPSAPSNSSIDLRKYSAPIYGFTNTNASNVDQKIYYTNTINLKTGIDLKLKDYGIDLEKLAKYVRSSKVEFVNIDSSDRSEVREYINKTVQSKLVEQFESADFRNEGISSWPKVFSYQDSDGTVYLSVRLSSKLGNYAIVKYKE